MLFITREFWSSKANWRLRFLLPSITLADFLGNRSLLQRVQFKASLEQFYIFNYAAEGQQEQVMVCDLWLVDFDPFNMCVCSCVARFVACDRNYDWAAVKNVIAKAAFELTEFTCFWKAQKARKRFKKTLDDFTLENLSASNVALDIRSFRSDLKREMSFTKPNNTSVCSVRSCASSMIRTLKNKKLFNWVQR